MPHRDPRAMHFTSSRSVFQPFFANPDGSFGLKIDHHRLLPSGFREGHRLSVRAVVPEAGGRRLLLVRSGKLGDFKFPGGGVEQGEDVATALDRELREEAGHVLSGSPRFLGAVEECWYEPGATRVSFTLTSRYYAAAVGPGRCAQALEGYEADLDFRPVWQTPGEAVAIHESLMASPPEGLRSWIRRETMILRWLADGGLEADQ